jgi:allantoin racemase
MMKLGAIIATISMTEEQLKERRQFLERICNSNTEIVMVKYDGGPLSIESEFEHEQSSIQIVQTMIKVQNDGFDAFIPWCGGDPGVIAGRERISIPVIGPFQSSCAIAFLLGFKFSIITPVTNPRLVELRLQALGLRERLASIRQIGMPVLELRMDIQRTASILEKLCQEAVAKDGADVIVFACMGLFGMAEYIKDRVAVPIIDPAWAAVQMAQTVVGMGLTHSPLAYPYPKSQNV